MKCPNCQYQYSLKEYYTLEIRPPAWECKDCKKELKFSFTSYLLLPILVGLSSFTFRPISEYMNGLFEGGTLVYSSVLLVGILCLPLLLKFEIKK